MITFIDDPTPEEKEEEGRQNYAHGVDTGLAQNSDETTTAARAEEPEGSSTIAPLSSGAKREFFIYAHPREMRSTASMPYLEEENTGLDPLTPESHEARWQRQNRITSYREVTWPVQNSGNVLNNQDRAESMHLEKHRSDMRRLSGRYNMQQTGRAEQSSMSSTNNSNNSRMKKKSNIGYSGYENFSCFTACLSCDSTVYVPLGQQKAFCKRCGTLTAIRKHESDEEIVTDTIAMLDLQLYN
jgi:hypothetical protein